VLSQEGKFSCIGNDPLAYARELAIPGLSFTGRKDGQVIGCAGLKPMWGGVALAWSMLSPEVRKHPFFLHRTVKRELERLARSCGFHRVELIVMQGFEAGKAWAKALGFESEGIRRKYTPDKQDIEVFVRLF
jgi:RimJ/RimL family protein N-acetyltransferase